LYLSTFSPLLANLYWKTALAMCRLTGIEPSLLLHPLDFMTGEDAPELKFFPGMDLPLERKLELLGRFLDVYTSKFDVVNMRRHADALRSSMAVAGTRTEAIL
jgi:hypothetical protein